APSVYLRDVFERTVCFLVLKAIPLLWAVLSRLCIRRHRIIDPRAIREEDVESPVVVVVKQGDSRSHGLEQILSGCQGRFLNQIDTDFFCDVGEVRRIIAMRGAGSIPRLAKDRKPTRQEKKRYPRQRTADLPTERLGAKQLRRPGRSPSLDPATEDLDGFLAEQHESDYLKAHKFKKNGPPCDGPA